MEGKKATPTKKTSQTILVRQTYKNIARVTKEMVWEIAYNSIQHY